MTIDWSVKFGDILTSVTIIVSVTALLISWSKDRHARETQQADAVRSAAARTLTAIDRWQLLNLSMYQRLQPAFVETSEKLAEDLDVVKARDHLWKEVSAQRTAIAGQILDEGIATSYVSLLAHFPEVRSQFIALFQRLNDIEEKVSSAFLTASQDDVLAFETRGASYTSAMLGNALRTTAEAHRTRLEEETTTTFKPHKDFLLDVIGKDNKEILRGSRSR